MFAVLMALTVGEARATGVRSPFPVAVRARIDVELLAAETAGQWDVTSRSPGNESRFMADLTAGSGNTGVLYLKGVSDWKTTDDALSRVGFRLDQGDYLHTFTWADSAHAALRLFGDERRFFTGELGTPVVEDDHAAVFEHRIGARGDANMRALRARYWVAGLDDGDTRRTSQYGSLQFSPRPAFVGVGYVHDNTDAGNHAVAKAEAAGYFKHTTAIVSFEESGTGNGAAFPSASWSDFESGDYYAAMPDNAATFFELRTHRTRIGENNLFDASYQYGAVGDEYTNDLSPLVPGSVTNRAWVDWAHRRYALDARLAAARVVRTGFENSTRRGIDFTARARTLDNAEWLFRAGAQREELATGKESDGFLHAAYTRELREFMGGIHVLVDDIGQETSTSAGAELRLNWSSTAAVSGRWIVTDRPGGSDALWMRLEFRPTRRAWVTLGYGRQSRGDDPYFIEDRDVMPGTGTGNVVTLSVRGDL
ncbi:MAG TPA: hypothetical protein VJS69_00220 [Candidatus Krumholzibacteria bacterium]|nr:hypothetical protein [Candidatus Krumholzibacteria bacterium]